MPIDSRNHNDGLAPDRSPDRITAVSLDLDLCRLYASAAAVDDVLARELVAEMRRRSRTGRYDYESSCSSFRASIVEPEDRKLMPFLSLYHLAKVEAVSSQGVESDLTSLLSVSELLRLCQLFDSMTMAALILLKMLSLLVLMKVY